MIDYEKLKLAHELAEKYKNESRGLLLTFCFGNLGLATQRMKTYTVAAFSEKATFIETDDIDDLITKLQELTQPEPKYEVGQEVWVIRYDTPIKAKILSIKKDIYCIESDGGITYIAESFIFLTREAVIKAEIEYWHKMLYPEIDCSHDFHKGVCKQCGEVRFIFEGKMPA